MDSLVILLVEDNPDHRLIIRKGLESNNVANEVVAVEDGRQALDYLHRKGDYRDPLTSPRPGLILLDIKLPKIDGFSVLDNIKNDPDLKSIPVIMLTSSEQEVDIAKSYRQGANSYISKPIQFDEFISRVRELKLYWVIVNRLPPEAAA